MRYGIVNSDGKLIAIFKVEVVRDMCFDGIFQKHYKNDFARVLVEDGIIIK